MDAKIIPMKNTDKISDCENYGLILSKYHPIKKGVDNDSF
jgi:hypothetical protein